jgi:hypothetical protein
MNRVLLLIVCLLAGASVGLAGALLTGNEWWYLAVPIVLAAGWLWVGTPEQCTNLHREP